MRYLALYAEINLFCILLLTVVLHRIMTGFDLQSSQRQLCRVLVSMILFSLLDLAWAFVDGEVFATSRQLNWLLNAAYFIQAGVMSYFWFVYSELVQQSRLMASRRTQLACAAPLLALIALTLLSWRTDWVFYIDSANVYHRGRLHLVQVLISYGYLCFTAVKALALSRRRENYAERARLRTLASFAVLPAVFGALQTLLPGTPLLCVGNTLAVLSVYFRFQEQLISVDPLTQLNNRNQMIRYLTGKMSQYEESRGRPGRHLYLMLMDLDYFKQINDRCGHVEGDMALVRVADTLRQVCAHHSHFIARYGGDEFILVCEAANDAEVEALRDQIHGLLAQEDGAAYDLKLSIGYAAYSRQFHTIQDFIAAADKELYRAKQART